MFLVGRTIPREKFKMDAWNEKYWIKAIKPVLTKLLFSDHCAHDRTANQQFADTSFSSQCWHVTRGAFVFATIQPPCGKRGLGVLWVSEGILPIVIIKMCSLDWKLEKCTASMVEIVGRCYTCGCLLR